MNPYVVDSILYDGIRQHYGSGPGRRTGIESGNLCDSLTRENPQRGVAYLEKKMDDEVNSVYPRGHLFALKCVRQPIYSFEHRENNDFTRMP